jgi:hypothetical protein
MNSHLPKGVPKGAQPKPPRQANDAEIGLFVDLTGANPSF